VSRAVLCHTPALWDERRVWRRDRKEDRGRGVHVVQPLAGRSVQRKRDACTLSRGCARGEKGRSGRGEGVLYDCKKDLTRHSHTALERFEAIEAAQPVSLGDFLD